MCSFDLKFVESPIPFPSISSRHMTNQQVASQPIKEVEKSPGGLRDARGPYVCKYFFFCWHTAVTAHKFLTYAYCSVAGLTSKT